MHVTDQATEDVRSPSGEMELVRRACRAALTGRSDARVPALLQTADRETLAALVHRNRLWVQVERGIRVSGGVLPRGLAAEHAAAQRLILTFNSRVMLTIRRIVPVLEAASVQVAVMKGPLHQQHLFGTLFARTSRDVDLLVPQDEVDRAVEALESLGYRISDDCRSMWWNTFLGERHLSSDRADQSVVDLHHLVQQPGCPAPRHLAEFIGRRTRVSAGGQDVPSLSVDHARLLSFISLAKALVHRSPAGAYAAEVAAIVIALDADGVALARVAALARHQGLEGTMRFAAAGAASLFGLDLPHPLHDPDRPLPDADTLAAMMLDPEQDGLAWPRRRSLLWSLCDASGPMGRPGAYMREVARVAGGELCRRASALAAGEPAAALRSARA